jgi:hypothetical protein
LRRGGDWFKIPKARGIRSSPFFSETNKKHCRDPKRTKKKKKKRKKKKGNVDKSRRGIGAFIRRFRTHKPTEKILWTKGGTRRVLSTMRKV